MTESAAESKRRGRSPNYPGVDLKTALDRARVLWDQEHHHAAPSELILKHWGYGPKSGGGAMVYAALKRFGLLEEVGDGKARLTQSAQAILLAEREGRRDDERLRRAAMLPPMHKEMAAKYPDGLASDETVKYDLITRRGFTPNGAADFLAEYKRTMEFAGTPTAEADSVTPPDEDETPSETETDLTPPPVIEAETEQVGEQERKDVTVEVRAQRTVQVPYSPTSWALVQAAWPMSEEDWDRMLAVLQAMKPGLVTQPKKSAQP